MDLDEAQARFSKKPNEQTQLSVFTLFQIGLLCGFSLTSLLLKLVV